MGAGDPTAVRHVVVVGGGITGLAAAHRLVEVGGNGVRVTLLEATERLGGMIDTGRCGEWTVELGPDGFIAREPEARALCAAVGLGGELVAARTARAGLWTGSRIRWLPHGLVLGVPSRLAPLRRSGILSAAGFVRAALEPLVPRRPVGPDDPLGPALRRRLGGEAFSRLVAPLLGGIYAGDAETLSLGAVAPGLLAALQGGGSLRRGLRMGAAGAGPDGAALAAPGFLTVAGGLGRLVDRLAEAAAPGTIRCGVRATGLARRADGTFAVAAEGEQVPPADRVILAVPAPAAAALLGPVNPGAARCLSGIAYASVATVTLAYPQTALASLPDASGFLVPRGEGRRLTACTFLSSKWPQLAAADVRLVRASVGRAGEPAALDLPDAQLAAEVHLELRRALGVRGAPAAITVRRWPDALPQYRAGHLGRVAALGDALRATPGLEVVGAAIAGVGLPACIRQGRGAAERCLSGPEGRGGVG